MAHSLASGLLALILASSWAAAAAAANGDPVLVLSPRVEAAPPEAPIDLGSVSAELDAVLREAVRDFGLVPAEAAPPETWDEPSLAGLAREQWVVAPRLSLAGTQLELRLVAVPAGSEVLFVRTQRFAPQQLEVRSLGMLREVLEPGLDEAEVRCPEPALVRQPRVRAAPRSEGAAVLALHTAALGGYLGYSLQRSSGSDDARLTYPLAALGAGAGLGSAVIVADEWDIDVPRAWFLGASMSWPVVGTLLIVDSDDRDAPGERHLLAVGAAVGGLTLATAGLALGDVDAGGAALVHSGGALGLLLGGLGEAAIVGDANFEGTQGMGIGALASVFVAGALATQLDVPSATDILFIDLSALLGGLAGAALGTPVLVSQEPSPSRDRIWISAVLAGTVAGAGIGYWLTQGDDASSEAASSGAHEGSAHGDGFALYPHLGWMGSPLGLGVSGQW